MIVLRLVTVIALTSSAYGATCSTAGDATSCHAPWEHAGPSGYTQLDKDEDAPTPILAAGAVQAVVQAGEGRWFMGSANGGVWRTANITAAVPHWDAVTDNSPIACQSISALAASSHDPKVVVAGCGGSTSSEMGTDWNALNDGDWAGLMISTDAGDTWGMVPSFPENLYVSGIVVLETGALLVAARSNFFDADAGGMWRSDPKIGVWERVFSDPVYGLEADRTSGTIYATVPFAGSPERSVVVSADQGLTWTVDGRGLSFKKGHAAFYPCIAVGPAALFFGALTVNVNDSTQTFSALFRRSLGSAASWVEITGGPDPDGAGLDDDAMPKDRMALLPHPTDSTTLFVAGNGDKIAFRVHVPSETWATMTDDKDTADGSAPHCDCRNFAWDTVSESLLLVSDGGVFRREQPTAAGKGRWVSSNGDYGGMEFLSATWDGRAARWVAGAQDNDVQLAPPNTSATSVSLGFVMGDGMVTAVDNVHNPARLWGTRQFLGSKRAENRRRRRRRRRRSNFGGGDEELPGFCFMQGTTSPKRICLDTVTKKSGFGPENFPFFEQPFGLNWQDPSKLVTWVAGVLGKQEGFWQVVVPDDAEKDDDIAEPTFVTGSAGGSIYTLVAGGRTAGQPDVSLIVAMNNSHLHFRSNVTTAGETVTHPLPVTYAQPYIWGYNLSTGQPILGPVSHGKTTSLAVSLADSALIAVTGRPEVATNAGEETIWVTRDEGRHWIDVTGNLDAVTATVARSRPSALALVDIAELNSSALLVGTVAGVFISWTDGPHLGRWARLGQCSDLPLVLTLGISYEPYSDTLVAATFGRGVYVIHGAKKVLAASRAQQDTAGCSAGSSVDWTPASSAEHLPTPL